jgi:tetratricopeptide (TPR) repeat protein
MLSCDLGPDSAPATQAALWFTKDRGKTWQFWGESAEAGGAIGFNADEDVLYGFYIVLSNDAGPSAPPPSPGTAPQQWVRVDRAAPVVQALSVRPDGRFSVNREIHLRWTATDDNLPDRPVALHYRTETTKAFVPIADALAARSAYKWAVPPEAVGRLEIKISATDHAGNTGTYVADYIHIEAARGPGPAGAAGPKNRIVETSNSGITQAADDPISQVPPVDRPEGPEQWAGPARRSIERGDPAPIRAAAYGEPDAGVDTRASLACKEARNKYDLGTWHRLRGEYPQAAARYQEALALDPKLQAARCDLAGVLLLRGDADAAERELQHVLTIDPTYRPALKGLALILARQRNYQSARETLDKVLLLEPRDAEAWLAFGDVMLFAGDRSEARRAWGRAALLGEASDVSGRAEKRLGLYSEPGPSRDDLEEHKEPVSVAPVSRR